jgi:hypothetical protein
MIQSHKNPNFPPYLQRVFPFSRLDDFAGDLSVLQSVQREMNGGETATAQAVRSHRIVSELLSRTGQDSRREPSRSAHCTL